MQVRRTRGIRPLTRCSLTQGSLARGSLARGSLARGSLTPGPLRIALGAMLAAAAITGCSASATPKAAPSAQACGAGRTAANVPIEIEVNHGQVSCSVALAVEKDYAAAIVAGQAPGNGGGGPVTVSGWKCQGFATPELLKTGDVSKCGKDGMQILAILKSPS
jgi:hypothetical protein